MNDKLPHEILADFALKKEANVVNIDGLDIYIDELEADALAKIIDKWYIPRPRFDDGTPIGWGDKYIAPKYGRYDPEELNRLSILTRKQLKEWDQEDEDTPDLSYEFNFFRPQDGNYRPKRWFKHTDADGVEIKIKDTVWDFSDSRATVKGFTDEFVKIELFGSDQFCYVDSKQLYHTKPNSIDRICNEMKHFNSSDIDRKEDMDIIVDGWIESLKNIKEGD